jgi:LPXTG-motif cell wall-anchored protein
MSRSTTSRLATAGMLTLATGLAGLVLAPSASAATTLDPVKLSATTVQPGQNFTISGTDCVSPADADYEGVAVVMSQDGDIYEEAEPAANGSWSITTAFPKDMAAGDQQLVAYCDWYTDGASYGEFTVKVGGAGSSAGAIRGVEANTPGTKPVTTDKTTTSSAPGQKVVRVIAGFQPHEWVTLTMHSTPTVVGKFQADANGVVTAEFTVPAGTPAGTHTFVYEGAAGTYFQESFTVTAGGKKLPHTGADVTVPLTLGLGLVVVGAGALVVSRRKTAEAPQV